MSTVKIPVFSKPVDASVRPPGSKSETIRAMAAAALADGRSHLYMPLKADDPVAMAGALKAFGINVADDTEPMAIDGRDGRLSPPEQPIDANESGLSARILLAMAASLDGSTTITGRGRLPERPMDGVVDVLRHLGVELSADRLPTTVVGHGRLWGGHITVDCSHSSQFATALMMVAPIMENPCVLEPTGLSGSEGYLDMTAAIMRKFGAQVERTVTGFEIANTGYAASDVVIEPDASAAVYPMAIAAVTGGSVLIDGLGQNTLQPDIGMAAILGDMGCRVEWDKRGVRIDARDIELSGIKVDMSAAPDASLALAVVCLFASGPSTISGLESLRLKESDRLEAISTEMRRIGGDVTVEDDALVIAPSGLHGGVIDPHGDHRIAMAMATAGTAVEGVSVANSNVVAKTWPDFWGLLELLRS